MDNSFHRAWLFKNLPKQEVLMKPGNASHTDKWDRCVQHVADHGGSANAYAVCTASMGDESFKSMDDVSFLAKVDEYVERLGISAGVQKTIFGKGLKSRFTYGQKVTFKGKPAKIVGCIYLGQEPYGSYVYTVQFADGSSNCDVYDSDLNIAKDVGIADAGPVPNSLLAEQDLAPTSEYELEAVNERREGQMDGAKYATRRKSFSKSEDSASTVNAETAVKNMINGFVPHEDIISELVSLHGLDQVAATSLLDMVLGRLGKGQVEEAKKDLIEMAEDTKDTTKTDLAANIKAAQLKSQKATIAARQAAGDAKGKSFGDEWRRSNA